jgi:hypothetical protein
VAEITVGGQEWAAILEERKLNRRELPTNQVTEAPRSQFAFVITDPICRDEHQFCGFEVIFFRAMALLFEVRKR